LQHLPSHAAGRVLCNAYHKLVPGGALIIAERISTGNGPYDSASIGATLFGATLSVAPDLSQLAIGGIAQTPAKIERALDVAGFQSFDCFYRLGNIAAWVAVKEA
jgi:hypothetical protein